VEPKYGDRTLAKFAAAAIVVAPCTLARYRDVYRAWKDICAPGRELPSYSVLRELAPHANRAQIIRDNPDITKSEAHALMRKQGHAVKEQQEQEQEAEWQRHNRKWFKDLVELANEATRMAGVVDECTPEQLDNLLKAVDPTMLMYVRGGGLSLIKVATALATRLGAEEELGPHAEAEALLEQAKAEASTRMAA
jgi:hypothetical protein